MALQGGLTAGNLNSLVEQLRQQHPSATQEVMQVEGNSCDVQLPEFVSLVKQQLNPASIGRLSFARRSILGLPVVSPKAWSIKLWVLFMLLVDLTYTAIYIPLSQTVARHHCGDGDGRDQRTHNVLTIDSAMGIVFVVDLFVKLHVGWQIKLGFLPAYIANGPGVLSLYAKHGHMWLDVVAALPAIVLPFLSIPQQPPRAVVEIIVSLRLLRLVRVLGIVKKLSRGDWGLSLGGRWLSMKQSYLLSLVYCLVVAINLLACLWYAGADWSGVPCNETWIGYVNGRDLTSGSVGQIYLAAVYYTVTTVTTTGYGDITPHTEWEELIAMFIMFCGALLLSFLIGTVAGMLMDSSPESQRAEMYRQQALYLDRWFNTHEDVDPAFQKVIDRHIKVYWTICLQDRDEWEHIVGLLTPGLKGELVLEVLKERFPVPLARLSDGVPLLVLLELLALADRRTLAPGDQLAWPGEEVKEWCLLQTGAVCSATLKQIAGSNVPVVVDRQKHLVDTLAVHLEAAKRGLNKPQPQVARNQECATAYGPPARPVDKTHLTVDLGSAQLVGLGEEAAAAAGDVEDGAGKMLLGDRGCEHTSLPKELELQDRQAGEPGSADGGGPSASSRVPPPMSKRMLKKHEHVSMLERALVLAEGQELRAPALFPKYALPAPPGEEAVAAEGATAAAAAAARCHPVVVRTSQASLLYAFDLGKTLDLCEACPQLHRNLWQLLQEASCPPS